MKKLITLAVLLLTWQVVPAVARPVEREPGPRLLQINMNFQFGCDDLGEAGARLERVANQCGAEITNLNLDAANGQGNANLRIPRGQVENFQKLVRQVGPMLSQNRSTSDYTSNYEQARDALELHQKLSQARWKLEGATLNPGEMAQAQAEWNRYHTDQMRSAENNLRNYEQHRQWAEVTIRLQAPPLGDEETRRRQARTNHPNQTKGVQQALQADEPGAVPVTPTTDSYSGVNWKLPVLCGFLAVCLVYFLRRRKA